MDIFIIIGLKIRLYKSFLGILECINISIHSKPYIHDSISSLSYPSHSRVRHFILLVLLPIILQLKKTIFIRIIHFYSLIQGISLSDHCETDSFHLVSIIVLVDWLVGWMKKGVLSYTTQLTMTVSDLVRLYYHQFNSIIDYCSNSYC